MVDAGVVPHRIYTNFDQKFLEGETTHWIHSNHGKLYGVPVGHQNQNGLVERSWQTLCSMSSAYITDMQMPRAFWFWAIRHAAQVMNCVPCTVDGVKTSSFELVCGIKPDYRVLFHLFSTSYIKHSSDVTHQCDGIAEATSL